MGSYADVIETYNAELVRMVVLGIKKELGTTVNVQESNERRYLNKKGACDYLGVSRPTLDKMIAKGLKVVLIDTVYRIDKQDIDEFMEKHKK